MDSKQKTSKERTEEIIKAIVILSELEPSKAVDEAMRILFAERKEIQAEENGS